MIKMPTKEIVLFLLGLGIGSTATYFGVKKRLEATMQEEMEQEIEAVKDYYILREEQSKKETKVSENEENEPKSTEKQPKRDKKEPDYEKIIEKLNYGEYYQKKETPSESTEAADQEEEIEVPYTISDEEYIEENYYEKTSLVYFENDGVFMDASSLDIINDGTELIGEPNLEMFGEYDEDTLYVRDDVSKTDYEVIMTHCAYAESEYYEHSDEY